MSDNPTTPKRTSVLTCPVCGDRQVAEMPTDACLYFHECVSCRTLLRPAPGDCCVFCSYGDTPCPPVQAADADAAPDRRPRR